MAAGFEDSDGEVAQSSGSTTIRVCFIKRESGEDVFVHHTEFRLGIPHIEQGEKASSRSQGPKGLQAENVRRVGGEQQQAS